MAELNITPLLDLVFVLLVIFIITTPQLMNNLELNLPSGKPPPKKPHEPKVHHIDLSAQGVIRPSMPRRSQWCHRAQKDSGGF